MKHGSVLFVLLINFMEMSSFMEDYCHNFYILWKLFT